MLTIAKLAYLQHCLHLSGKSAVRIEPASARQQLPQNPSAYPCQFWQGSRYGQPPQDSDEGLRL